MSDETEMPTGCPGCNPEEIAPILESRAIKVEEVPRPRHAWGDVLCCDQCGRCWLLMPRPSDSEKPVA
jgi:hypothetical protein